MMSDVTLELGVGDVGEVANDDVWPRPPLCIKQIGVRTSSRRNEDKLVLIDRINKQPVWPHVAFSKTVIVARKRMIAMALFERLLGTKLVKNCLKFGHVQAALLCPLVILLELRGGTSFSDMEGA